MAAMSLTKAAARVETAGVLSVSFNLLRNFSSSASQSSQNPISASSKPKRRRKKNLFEVAQFLPNWGIGYHMAKTHWSGVSYEITKINLYKDGRHGKAWGIVHKDGLTAAEAPKKISGVHKRCWKYIPNLSKPSNSTNPIADIQSS
ncbi:PREDICTED: uncharacterized protein LOC104799412 [Tarenaya hassleriana]|uniref:uncharacterized protein LOC104799412 n=1 Tax=Tarenaya hassleriana TaxID=28532 RepID=UPI00053C940D|nr:PREDICTED: uncharacterized protein LOC104799412 [Tarenaya hassleriana]XP_010520238.1 PREDICTED: uncharacterized protein LOC104799412 [Tarenaya hassleriana]